MRFSALSTSLYTYEKVPIAGDVSAHINGHCRLKSKNGLKRSPSSKEVVLRFILIELDKIQVIIPIMGFQ
jgi:hypothetical protein